MSAADKIEAARALIEPLTGYTPGEWVMSAVHPTNACANVRCEYTDVATLYGGDSDTPTPADGEPWGPQPIRDANARLTAAAPALRDTVAALADLADAQAQENARLREALQNVMGHVDTPIARRRLGIGVDQPEWLMDARAVLGEAP